VRLSLLLSGILMGALILAGCEKDGYEPPPETRRIELADSLYSPALFDTIAWESEEDRVYAGNLVYADSCRRCHGPYGEGGHAQAAGRELFVPSLLEREWRLEGDIEAVRHLVFTGHTGGMPTWGLVRLTPRQIDAVAYYILEQLRPELMPRAPAGP
jgi:mono/diheme cytochrome c family protein